MILIHSPVQKVATPKSCLPAANKQQKKKKKVWCAGLKPAVRSWSNTS